ncbi:MAG: hypothetical protein JW704_02555 [Anaerolineaceae bacterium]|nr:hypothetical protein [Anaerolineaceae bacterium]
MRKLIKRLEEDYKTLHEVKVVLNESALGELMPLLNEVKRLGDVGASRTIKIEDWDGKNVFGFDGDGPSKIQSIEEKKLD